MLRPLPTLLALLAVFTAGPAPLARAQESRAEVPPGIPVDGFQQLLPRGAIPALIDPEFVPAAAADLPDDAWVLGFELAGKAFAYDLNLLNSHEVVNHEIGGRNVAAVW